MASPQRELPTRVTMPTTLRPTFHQPFESIYRTNFEVVEERHEAVRLYPHSEQLPVLLRALNLEFHGGLPDHIARVDQRADGFHKILRRMAALVFCNSINVARTDRLRLLEVVDLALVAQVAIVQHLTVERRQGLLHWFRFYAGPGWVPEIYLSGKRVLFTDHVLERFSTRVPNPIVGADLSNFLLMFFGTPHIAMEVGPGWAFIVPYANSILALTFQETEKEFIVTTCLTMDEINSLKPGLPPRAFNLHYGTAFTVPRVRHWLPTQWMMDRYQCWQHKTPVTPLATIAQRDWPRVGHWVKDHMIKQGHGPGSQIVFVDHIPGPCVMEMRPGAPEPRYNELEVYQKTDPRYDWERIFAEREGRGAGRA